MSPFIHLSLSVCTFSFICLSTYFIFMYGSSLCCSFIFKFMSVEVSWFLYCLFILSTHSHHSFTFTSHVFLSFRLTSTAGPMLPRPPFLFCHSFIHSFILRIPPLQRSSGGEFRSSLTHDYGRRAGPLFRPPHAYTHTSTPLHSLR